MKKKKEINDYDWVGLYHYKNNFLKERGYVEVKPFDFYRDLFPIGSLQKKGEFNNHKGNIVGISIDKNERKNNRKIIVFDDLNDLDKLINVPFGLIAPVNYFGKNRTSDNARFLFAMTIDIDFVTEPNIRDLFHQIKHNLHAMPTYVVNSGRGLHLYYFLKDPVPLYKHYQKTLREFKEAMIRRLWNGYTSIRDERDMTGVLQGFRTVGSYSKLGKDYPVIAFKTGDRYSLEELKIFTINYDGDLTLKFPVKSKKQRKSLEYYKKNFPEWYQERIIEGKPKPTEKGRWFVKRALYDWWKAKIKKEIKVGHRYFSIMALAIYGQKCGIPFEEVEQDALSFFDYLEDKTNDLNNHFTLEDIYHALDCYNEKYVRFPRKVISQLTDVSIPPNKRNYLKQKEHLEIARAIQEIKNRQQNKNWRDNNGRKSKEDIVLEWKNKNPNGTKKQCKEETGLTYPTIRKYWNKVKIDFDFEINLE